jgi:hypothetical protein
MPDMAHINHDFELIGTSHVLGEIGEMGLTDGALIESSR